MSWLYNRHFKIGAAVAVIAFVVANAASYLAESRHVAELAVKHPNYCWSCFSVWGWPWPWVDWVAAANFAVLMFGALFFGLLFRWITGFFK